MFNILFYGNCQTKAIMETLNLNKKQYVVYQINCHETNVDEPTFLKYIKMSDVIVTQPISDNYRGKPYLTTSFIIQNSRPDTRIIMFDSCYFNFYHFDSIHKEILPLQFHYHYKTIFHSIVNNISSHDHFMSIVNNYDFKSTEELDNIANESLDEIKRRSNESSGKYKAPNVCIISIHDFVKLNYKEKLLFYTVNHPSKYVFHYISEEIINHLQIENTINYDIDPLNCIKTIIYKCVQKNVNFDISNYNPNDHDAFTMVNWFWKAYSNIDVNVLKTLVQ